MRKVTKCQSGAAGTSFADIFIRIQYPPDVFRMSRRH